MTAPVPRWRVVVASGSEIGERPIWDPSTKALLWLETLGGGIHRSSPDDGPDDRDPIDLVLPTGHRFNDGACDPAGRFLIGTAGTCTTRRPVPSVPARRTWPTSRPAPACRRRVHHTRSRDEPGGDESR